MATEKTIFTNVVRNEEATTNNNPKNPITYRDNFKGTEELKFQPETFEAFGKTTRMNSAELSRKIYAHFKQTFHELRGCNLFVMPNGQISVEMFFERNTEPLPDGKIMNLDSLIEPVGAGSRNNLYDRMQVTQNRFRGKTFTLNNETKLLLSKFMYGGKNANMPNNNKIWGNETILREVPIPTNDPFIKGHNTHRILVRVANLDIHRILQEIYGHSMVTKTVAKESGDTNYRSEARYEVRFIKANIDGTFIMNIEQFDSAAIEKIFVQENPLPQMYLGVQMYS